MIRICPWIFIFRQFNFFNVIRRVRPGSSFYRIIFRIDKFSLVKAVKSSWMNLLVSSLIYLLWLVSDEWEWVLCCTMNNMLTPIKLRRVQLKPWGLTFSRIETAFDIYFASSSLSFLRAHNDCLSFLWTHWLFSHILNEVEASLSQKLLNFVIVKILLIEMNTSQVGPIFSPSSRSMSLANSWSTTRLPLVDLIDHFSDHFSFGVF